MGLENRTLNNIDVKFAQADKTKPNCWFEYGTLWADTDSKEDVNMIKEAVEEMVNDNYDDPGATCSFRGKDISQNVVATGDSVHLATDGTYKITYSCKTDEGRVAVSKTRIVVVQPSLPRIST